MSKQTNWEEEFDENWEYLYDVGAINSSNAEQLATKIKSFIRKIIKQELKKFAEAVRLEERENHHLDYGKPTCFTEECKPVWDGGYYTCKICGYEFVPANLVNDKVAELNQKIKKYLEKYE